MTYPDLADPIGALYSRYPSLLDGPLSIVIPIYNEQGSINVLVEEIIACLDQKLEYEILIVDDGSSDDSVARVLALRQANAVPLRLVRHRSNLGQSTALYSGINMAQSEWVATLDGDGQNDPADILRMLEQLGNGPDNLELICGYRRQRMDAWIRRVCGRVANAVRSRLLCDDTPDTGCGIKLIKRSAFLALPFFDHMHRFLPALIKRQGGAVISLEVHHRARRHGYSKYGLHDRLWVGIVDLFGVYWLQRRGRIPDYEEVANA